ncbi:MAG: shikimate dehydrogenase [Bacteroidales bacterium]|jgi:shikimate dehydrogenase|nr:shikimate dehydrogenase [Bacteroidales bacterium]
MVLFGLIGYPLGHSWSATLFTEKFRKDGKINYRYRLFPITDVNDFKLLIENHPALSGLNVTVPYKEKIIPLLDELDETARTIGAVNTITISRNHGKIHTRGYNTDAAGFMYSLPDPLPYSSALILGTGGAAKAVAYAFRLMKIEYMFVSRTIHSGNIITYKDITEGLMNQYKFIINATPTGMYPEIGYSPPIPYHYLTRAHFLYDLIYNPAETVFLKHGLTRECKVMNGKRMFIHQADLAYTLFLELQH